ncbi:MAG: ubiquitin-like small modifier protein 1 [Candidatus Hadarchaeales archaeon]
MPVTVKFFANFREATGVEQVEISAGDVSSLLDELVKRFGERLAGELFSEGRLKDTVYILVNGMGISSTGGLKTRLRDGDVVAIFPPVSGGV